MHAKRPKIQTDATVPAHFDFLPSLGLFSDKGALRLNIG